MQTGKSSEQSAKSRRPVSEVQASRLRSPGVPSAWHFGCHLAAAPGRRLGGESPGRRSGAGRLVAAPETC